MAIRHRAPISEYSTLWNWENVKKMKINRMLLQKKMRRFAVVFCLSKIHTGIYVHETDFHEARVGFWQLAPLTPHETPAWALRLIYTTHPDAGPCYTHTKVWRSKSEESIINFCVSSMGTLSTRQTPRSLSEVFHSRLAMIDSDHKPVLRKHTSNCVRNPVHGCTFVIADIVWYKK